MANYYYNDVLLPEIRADVLSMGYSFCIIIKDDETGYYYLYCTQVPAYCKEIETSYGEALKSIEFAGEADETYAYMFKTAINNPSTTSWGSPGYQNKNWLLDADTTLLWSNHNIPNGSATATEIYFAGSDPVLAHSHSYTESVTQAATCTTAGVKTYTCECGRSYSAEIPATGHSYSEVVTTEATCTTDGLKTFSCSCGDSYTEVIPATGKHTSVNGVCTVCGAVVGVDFDEILPDADVNIEGVPDVPADILVNFPYAVISNVTVNSSSYYLLVASVSEFYYVPKGVLMSSEVIGTLGNARAYTVKNGSWSQEAEYEAGNAYATLGNLGENTNADLSWSNHDIYIVDRVNASTGEYELGRVYFQNSEYTGDNGDFTVTHYYYNGVLLPEIPPEVLTEYPYCWIRENTQTGYYDLFLAKTPWYQSDASTIATDSYTQGIQWYRVPFTGTSGEWQSYQVWDSSSGLTSETGRKIIWANHNIPVGSATSTDIYFAGSSAIPNAESYEIQRETIVALADQVRRLYNSTAPLTPAQMEAKLANLNIELQEAHVSVSEEEQIIRPDVGYYGFSSVIVEAFEMDDSGGGLPGGDDSGDDTEEGENAPSAEDSGALFGYYWNDDVSLYGDGRVLPSPPDANPYIIVLGNGNFYYLATASVPFVFDNYDLYTQDGSPCNCYSVWMYDKSYNQDASLVGIEWSKGAEYPGNEPIWSTVGGGVIFTNHDILGKSDGSVRMSKTGDVVKTDESLSMPVTHNPNQYIITGTTLNSIAQQVQMIVGYKKPMSLGGIVSQLTTVPR